MRAIRWVPLGLALATAACVVPWTAFAGRQGEGVTLQFVVWGMPFEDRLFEDDFARGFEARRPGVRIAYERYQDPSEKYFAWHLVGRGADVMRVRITDYHALVSRGVLMPLDGYIDDPLLGLTAAEQADFTPAIWSALQIDGSRFALPSDNAQYGLYWNKSLFAAAGLEPPDASWTWDDLRNAALLLTVRDAGGSIVRHGIDFELWAWPFMALLVQAGGAMWDEDRTTTLIDSPAGLEALELIGELLEHTASMRSVAQTGSASGPDKLFAGGQAAMLLDGSWRAPDLERAAPGLDFAIAPLPRHRRSAVVCGSVLWAISAHARHPEEAWRMIRWMTAPGQSLRYWEALRVAPPARLSVLASDAFDGERTAWLQFAVTPDPETGEAPGFVPVAPWQKDLEDAIEAMLKSAVSAGGRDELAGLLDEAAESVHRIIDRDRRAAGLPAIDRGR